jgi:hypothetical protein
VEVRVGAAVDIMAPPGKTSQLREELVGFPTSPPILVCAVQAGRGIQHTLHIQDVQELIEQEKVGGLPM